MVLDISAYGGLEELPAPILDESGDTDANKCFYHPLLIKVTEERFPGRTRGLKAAKAYSWKTEFSFSAGSYSGYNFWRDCLDELRGDTTDFDELIHFSDCEGVIGPVVAKKLYEDFEFHEERSFLSQESFFISRYQDFMKAFKIASNKGAVEFC
jgi:hypothetical protein